MSTTLRRFLAATLLWIAAVLINPPWAHAQLTGTCPIEQGEWKNHPEAWPRLALVVGNPDNSAHTYTQSELLALLSLPTRGDVSIILSRQLIAAKLNLFNGSDPAPVESTLSQADSFFSVFPGKLPYDVKPTPGMGKSTTGVAEPAKENR